MREGPLAELFRATEAAQKQSEGQAPSRKKSPPADEPHEQTVEHVPTWEESVENVVAPPPAPAKKPPRAPKPTPVPEPELPPVAQYSLPEAAPRIFRAPRGEAASYLAVIRVVGV